MSVSEPTTQLSLQDQLKTTEQVRDLFARAHDYIHQANYPGHMGMKVAEVLNFLQFHHADFKNRVDQLNKQIEASKTVDVEAAKRAVDAVLEQDEKHSQVQNVDVSNE